MIMIQMMRVWRKRCWICKGGRFSLRCGSPLEIEFHVCRCQRWADTCKGQLMLRPHTPASITELYSTCSRLVVHMGPLLYQLDPKRKEPAGRSTALVRYAAPGNTDQGATNEVVLCGLTIPNKTANAIRWARGKLSTATDIPGTCFAHFQSWSSKILP